MEVCEKFLCTLQELPSRMSTAEVQLWLAKWELKRNPLLAQSNLNIMRQRVIRTLSQVG